MAIENCSNVIRVAGKAYPRTCVECELGPCKYTITGSSNETAPVVLNVVVQHENFEPVFRRALNTLEPHKHEAKSWAYAIADALDAGRAVTIMVAARK